MLAYRHAFHAGNPGDCLKHALLVQLLKAMGKKDKPFLYLESHAAAGLFDLDDPQAQKTGEYMEGIARLMALPSPSQALADYLDQVRALNPDGQLRHYPGSPWLAKQLTRAQDRLALCELHPNEFPLLQANMRDDRRVQLHQRDGLEAVRSLLPASEKRALVHIDPAYEIKDEYAHVAKSLREAYRRMRGAVFGIWYPLLANRPVEPFLNGLAASGAAPILRVELSVRGRTSGMYGSGVAVVNPPWGFVETAGTLVQELHAALSGPGGEYLCDWLVPEGGNGD